MSDSIAGFPAQVLSSTKGYKPYLLAFISGMIYPTGFAPLGIWPLTLVSILFFYSLLKYSPAKPTGLGFCYGFGQFGIGTSWVYVSIHQFGGAAVALAIIITLLFTAYLSLYPALLGLLFNWYQEKASSPKLGLMFIFLWLLIDGLRGWVFSGFPWLYAGYSGIDTVLASWAPLIGIHGLTLIIVGTAVLIEKMFCNKHLHPKDFFSRQWQLPGLVLLLVWGSSLGLAEFHWSKVDGEPVTVTLIQPDISQDLKWEANHLRNTLTTLDEMTLKARGQLVVWPESALPIFEDRIRPYLTRIARRSALKGQSIVTGVPVRDSHSKKYYSAAMVLNADNMATAEKYYKRRLVPFGEYVPLEDQLRGLIEFFNLPMSGFSLGPSKQNTLHVDGLSMGIAICYEIVYPRLVYDQSRQANMILTISNDAWFGNSWGPQQHLEMARMRALETALPVLRGTNNGITALIDYKGKVVSQLPQNTQQALEISFQPRRSHSPIQYYSFWWVAIISLAIVIGLQFFSNRQK